MTSTYLAEYDSLLYSQVAFSNYADYIRPTYWSITKDAEVPFLNYPLTTPITFDDNTPGPVSYSSELAPLTYTQYAFNSYMRFLGSTDWREKNDPENVIILPETETEFTEDNAPNTAFNAESYPPYFRFLSYTQYAFRMDNFLGPSVSWRGVPDGEIPIDYGPTAVVTPPHQEFSINDSAFVSGAESLTNDNNPDVTIIDYLWNWGDGTTSTGVVAEHKYSALGAYNGTLTVIDSRGLSDTAPFSVQVNNFHEYRVLYACAENGDLFVTLDDGDSWRKYSMRAFKPATAKFISALCCEADVENKAVAYFGFNNGKIYKTRNALATVEGPIVSVGDHQITSIALDSKTEKLFFSTNHGHVFRMDSDGFRPPELMGHFPGKRINVIKIHADGGMLLVGGDEDLGETTVNRRQGSYIYPDPLSNAPYTGSLRGLMLASRTYTDIDLNQQTAQWWEWFTYGWQVDAEGNVYLGGEDRPNSLEVPATSQIVTDKIVSIDISRLWKYKFWISTPDKIASWNMYSFGSHNLAVELSGVNDISGKLPDVLPRVIEQAYPTDHDDLIVSKANHPYLMKFIPAIRPDDAWFQNTIRLPEYSPRSIVSEAHHVLVDKATKNKWWWTYDRTIFKTYQSTYNVVYEETGNKDLPSATFSSITGLSYQLLTSYSYITGITQGPVRGVYDIPAWEGIIFPRGPFPGGGWNWPTYYPTYPPYDIIYPEFPPVYFPPPPDEWEDPNTYPGDDFPEFPDGYWPNPIWPPIPPDPNYPPSSFTLPPFAFGDTNPYAQVCGAVTSGLTFCDSMYADASELEDVGYFSNWTDQDNALGEPDALFAQVTLDPNTDPSASFDVHSNLLHLRFSALDLPDNVLISSVTASIRCKISRPDNPGGLNSVAFIASIWPFGPGNGTPGEDVGGFVYIGGAGPAGGFGNSQERALPEEPEVIDFIIPNINVFTPIGNNLPYYGGDLRDYGTLVIQAYHGGSGEAAGIPCTFYVYDVNLRVCYNTEVQLAGPITINQTDIKLNQQVPDNFEVGKVILVDDEKMKVVEIQGDTLIVERGYDDTYQTWHGLLERLVGLERLTQITESTLDIHFDDIDQFELAVYELKDDHGHLEHIRVDSITRIGLYSGYISVTRGYNGYTPQNFHDSVQFYQMGGQIYLSEDISAVSRDPENRVVSDSSAKFVLRSDSRVIHDNVLKAGMLFDMHNTKVAFGFFCKLQFGNEFGGNPGGTFEVYGLAGIAAGFDCDYEPLSEMVAAWYGQHEEINGATISHSDKGPLPGIALDSTFTNGQYFTGRDMPVNKWFWVTGSFDSNANQTAPTNVAQGIYHKIKETAVFCATDIFGTKLDPEPLEYEIDSDFYALTLNIDAMSEFLGQKYFMGAYQYGFDIQPSNHAYSITRMSTLMPKFDKIFIGPVAVNFPDFDDIDFGWNENRPNVTMWIDGLDIRGGTDKLFGPPPVDTSNIRGNYQVGPLNYWPD